MLRARPNNEVLARAERIQLLCVFRGFGSRRSMAQILQTRRVCAARGSLLQPLAGFCSASGSARRPPAIDAMRTRSLRVQTTLVQRFAKKRAAKRCAKYLMR